jgi:hypothetical protein
VRSDEAPLLVFHQCVRSEEAPLLVCHQRVRSKEAQLLVFHQRVKSEEAPLLVCHQRVRSEEPITGMSPTSRSKEAPLLVCHQRAWGSPITGHIQVTLCHHINRLMKMALRRIWKHCIIKIILLWLLQAFLLVEKGHNPYLSNH